MGCLPLTYEKTSPSTGLRVVYRGERLNQGHPGMKGSKNQGKECLVFGMMQVGRSYNTPNYRYGFNGKEKDDEVTGVTGVTYDYGFRTLDTRIVRFWSVDPLEAKYPNLTPYCAFDNSPIYFNDPDGKDATVTIKDKTVTISTKVYIWGSAACAKTAATIQASIMKTWASKQWRYTDDKTGKTYNVKFNVEVQVYNPVNPKEEPGFFSEKNNPFSRSNFIKVINSDKELSPGHDRSFVWGVGGDEGEWVIGSEDHEWGHLIGARDHYTEHRMPKSTEKYTTPDDGWDFNLYGGFPNYIGFYIPQEGDQKDLSIDQRNIDEIVKPVVDKYNNSKSNSNDEYNTDIDGE
jgi:RHS repeat-associated protein